MLAEKLRQGTIERIDVSGVGIELWSAGRGRPLLFLSPGDGVQEHAPLLEKLAQTYQVFAPSHPGFGGSDRPAAITTVDDISYVYLDMMRAPRFKNAVVVGVSFGAWIAAELCTKCTHNIAGLVLVDAVGVKFSDRRTRDITDIFSLPQYKLRQIFYRSEPYRSMSYAEYSNDDLVQFAKNHESFAFFAWAPTLHNPKLAGRLHLIDVPTLVVWGADDQIVSTEYGRRLASSIPGSSFSVIESAGHYAHLDRQEDFTRRLNDFVATLPSDRLKSAV